MSHTEELSDWIATSQVELAAMVHGAREALGDGVAPEVLAPRMLGGVLQRIDDGLSDDLIGALVLAVLALAEIKEGEDR